MPNKNYGFTDDYYNNDPSYKNNPDFSRRNNSRFNSHGKEEQVYGADWYKRQEAWDQRPMSYSNRSESLYPTRRTSDELNKDWLPHESEPNYYSQEGRYEPSYDQVAKPVGRHVGKAPKGYKRSDERIREDVCEALSEHPEIDASQIEVHVKNGIVNLTGTIESRQIKRLTEETIENLPGVVEVDNDIRIVSASTNATPTAPTFSSAKTRQ